METKRFLFFYQSLDRIVKDIKRLETSYLEDYGLRSVHTAALLYIKGSECGLTATQLAASSKTDKALVSRTLRELLDREFVSVEGGDKAYNKRYLLAKKGEALVSDIEKDIVDYMTRARVGVSEENLLDFYEILKTLVNNISLIACEEQ